MGVRGGQEEDGTLVRALVVLCLCLCRKNSLTKKILIFQDISKSSRESVCQGANEKFQSSSQFG